MDEDLPSPVTDYNPGVHTTNALKKLYAQLNVYTQTRLTFMTHVNYMYKYPESLFAQMRKKTLNAVKFACHFIFGLTLTEEI